MVVRRQFLMIESGVRRMLARIDAAGKILKKKKSFVLDHCIFVVKFDEPYFQSSIESEVRIAISSGRLGLHVKVMIIPCGS